MQAVVFYVKRIKYLAYRQNRLSSRDMAILNFEQLECIAIEELMKSEGGGVTLNGCRTRRILIRTHVPNRLG